MAKPSYFAVETDGDTMVVCAVTTIVGLVEDAAREEWDALLKQFDAGHCKHAVVDLGTLDYFGSIMLELLVVLWKRVSAHGGKLALCRVSPVGLEILRTAKFDTLWPIVPDRATALVAVRS